MTTKPQWEREAERLYRCTLEVVDLDSGESLGTPTEEVQVAAFASALQRAEAAGYERGRIAAAKMLEDTFLMRFSYRLNEIAKHYGDVPLYADISQMFEDYYRSLLPDKPKSV